MGEWLKKTKTVVNPYHGTLLSNRKKRAIDAHDHLNESPRIILREKERLKGLRIV